MYALCIESSHTRGMGHFYRSLNLADGLVQAGQKCMIYLNHHDPSQKILHDRGVPYRLVDLQNFSDNWERSLIRQDGITLWVNDRLDTDFKHAQKIKAEGIPLVTFDDRGTGAILANINIAALAYHDGAKMMGATVLQGIDYLILNSQIHDFLRLRMQLSSIVVTLGGSDTHGVTVKVVQLLMQMKLTATIILGPGFMHMRELQNALNSGFIVKHGVVSMIEEFYHHDLAITGGGITPFEANASGLPCVVIASEAFEVPVGKALQKLGGSIFAGHYKTFRLPFLLEGLPIKKMSRLGMQNIRMDGMQKVIKALLELSK